MRKVLLAVILVLLVAAGRSNAVADQPVSQEYITANRMFAEGKYSYALSIYQGVFSSAANDVSPGEVQSRIGDCYFQLGDYKNALTSYRSALLKQKTSQRPATQYWIGFCSLLLGNAGDAVTEFLKVPAVYPSSGMWVNTSYYWAGRASELMGKKDQAAAYYKKAGENGKTTQGRFAMKKAEAVKSK